MDTWDESHCSWTGEDAIGRHPAEAFQENRGPFADSEPFFIDMRRSSTLFKMSLSYR